MNTEILIEVRDVYGTPTCYPINDQAKALAQIAGTKTLTHQTLALAERMGFTIKQAPRAAIVFKNVVAA